MNKNIAVYFKKILIILIVLSLICSLNTPGISRADTQSDYDENNRELEELRKAQSALSSELARLNEQLEATGAKIAQAEEQINAKAVEITSLQDSLSQMEQTRNAQYDAMKLRIQYMYENNNLQYIEIFLGAQSLSDLLVRTEYVQQMSKYDRNMLDEYNNLINVQKLAKIKLDHEMNELVALKSEAENESRNLKSLIASQNSKMNANSDNIARAEKLAIEYERRIQEEFIAAQMSAIQNADSSVAANAGPISYDASDLTMLAAIIECEAGNQPYEGKIAVGSVVINRVRDPRFANSISGVLYSPMQFSPVASGRFSIVMSRGASADCVTAARDVLNGHINIDALYFHVYNSAVDFGGTVIGDHVFY